MSRADPLPPDARRESIVSAVIPLLMARGPAVTTKEMAEAAGVAEGTIFSVFEDKTEVIKAAFEKAVDPAPVVRALSEIHDGAPIEVQLAEAARILNERLDVFYALGPLARSLFSERRLAEGRGTMISANAAVTAALSGLLERQRHRLRVEPAKAAAAFGSLVFAGRLFLAAPDERLAVDEVVELFLHGIAETTRVGRA